MLRFGTLPCAGRNKARRGMRSRVWRCLQRVVHVGRVTQRPIGLGVERCGLTVRLLVNAPALILETLDLALVLVLRVARVAAVRSSTRLRRVRPLSLLSSF